MASKNRISVKFKSKSVENFIKYKSEKANVSMSSFIENLVIEGIRSRMMKGEYELGELEKQFQEHGNIYNSIYTNEFLVNKVIKKTECSKNHNDSTQEIFLGTSLPKKVNTGFRCQIPFIEAIMPRRINKGNLKRCIIDDLQGKLPMYIPEIPPWISLVIITEANITFQKMNEKESADVDVNYRFLLTPLYPQGGGEQYYHLDLMNIKYMRFTELFRKAGRYRKYLQMLHINEAKTRGAGGYFVGVLNEPVKIKKMVDMQKVSEDVSSNRYITFADNQIISVKLRTFPKPEDPFINEDSIFKK